MPDRSDRILVWAAALVFAACETQEGQSPPPGTHPTAGTVTSSSAPVVQAPVPATATATLAALVDKPVERDPIVPPSRAEKKKGDCKTQLPWTQLRRCTHEGWIYAVGSLRGNKELSLARTGAAMRARQALDPKSKQLAGTEVVDFFRCRGTSYALARMHAPEGLGGVPACDGALLASLSPVEPGCPDWANAVSWREGDRLYSVGAVKLKNRALAEATAVNRARAELAQLLMVRSGKDTHGADTQHATASAPESFSEIGREQAQCGGYTFVKLAARAMADGH
jgi:hypothetical protein